jgi:hypothetical protein
MNLRTKVTMSISVFICLGGAAVLTAQTTLMRDTPEVSIPSLEKNPKTNSTKLSLAQDHKNSGVSAPKPSIPPFPKEESFSEQVNFMRTLNNEQLEKRIEEIELGSTFKELTAKKNSEELNELESEALRVLLSEVAAIHAVRLERARKSVENI